MRCVQPDMTTDEVRTLLRLAGILKHAELRNAGGTSDTSSQETPLSGEHRER